LNLAALTGAQFARRKNINFIEEQENEIE
jgi:hypothetical protein